MRQQTGNQLRNGYGKKNVPDAVQDVIGDRKRSGMTGRQQWNRRKN